MLIINIANPKNFNTAAVSNKINKNVIAQIFCTLILKLGNILINKNNSEIIAKYFLKTVKNNIKYYTYVIYKV